MRSRSMALVTACIVVSACASSLQQTLDSWLGHQQNELIQRWGPPSKTTDDGGGGRILIYESFTPNPFAQQPGIGVLQVKMFYVRADGTIYLWKTCGRANGPYGFDSCGALF